jgi:hypothetical protein
MRLLRVPTRALILGVLLVLTSVGVVRADAGLTDAVAAAYFPRTVDSALHAIAHERAEELSACACLEHDGIRPGTAEVLAWNTGEANPAGGAVQQWINSALHDGILSDTSYGRIGCADVVSGAVHWFACVLAAGPLPAPSAPSVGLLPNTAISSHAHGVGVRMRSWPA